MRQTPKPRLLMCSPEYYGVEYVINPWMEEGRRHFDFRAARPQWTALKEALSETLDAEVETIAPRKGLPDMVFTANAGLVAGRVFIPSRFRYAERAREEPHFIQWAECAGFRIQPLPDGMCFEGAGDALFDRGRPLLWMGHGFRTDWESLAALDESVEPLGFQAVPLRLVDPRFYHLDTCFCPLAGGHTLYYPAAFAPESRATIERLIPQEYRIQVSDSDAAQFACNAVNIEDGVVLNAASEDLRSNLEDRGFRVTAAPLSEFLFAGGAAKCLTLRLDDPQALMVPVHRRL